MPKSAPCVPCGSSPPSLSHLLYSCPAVSWIWTEWAILMDQPHLCLFLLHLSSKQAAALAAHITALLDSKHAGSQRIGIQGLLSGDRISLEQGRGLDSQVELVAVGVLISWDMLPLGRFSGMVFFSSARLGLASLLCGPLDPLVWRLLYLFGLQILPELRL